MSEATCGTCPWLQKVEPGQPYRLCECTTSRYYHARCLTHDEACSQHPDRKREEESDGKH